MKFVESIDPDVPKRKRFMSTALKAGEFTIIAEVRKHHMDFWAYECIGHLAGDIWIPSYQKKNTHSWPVGTEDISDAEPYIFGYVKLDGCIHWKFRTNDDGYEHWCGRSHVKEELARLERLFDRLYDAVNELLPSYDGDDQ